MLSIACVIVTLMLMSDGMQQHRDQLTWEGGSSQILHFNFLSDSMLITSCCTASPRCVFIKKECQSQEYWTNTKPAPGSMRDDLLMVSITCTTSTLAVDWF